MAKKKAKKETAKKPRKKPAKKRYPLPRPTGLQAKILKIMALCKIIKCTGIETIEADDPTQNETYHYTEAAEVFRVYSEAMIEVGLTFVPINVDAVLDTRAYRATITYRLTDPETGQYQDVVAVGLGCNGVWALNSAQTVARKQALLNTFGASYPQPKTAAQVVRKAVKMFEPHTVLTTEQAVNELKKHDFFNKEPKDGSQSRESVQGGKPAGGPSGADSGNQTGRKRTTKTAKGKRK
jgi:hypothetical protein